MKLFITDAGDSSVGISPQTWAIDAPLSSDHHEDKEELEWFRNAAIDLYKEYAEGKLTALYDFEVERIEQSYKSINHE